MPKFFAGAIFFTLLSWMAFVLYGTFVGPDHLVGIAAFYFLLHISLGLTLSFPVFYYFHKRLFPSDTDLKKLYKKSIKYGLYLSFGLVGFIVLESLDLLNPLNIILFCLFYIVLFLQIKAKK